MSRAALALTLLAFLAPSAAAEDPLGPRRYLYIQPLGAELPGQDVEMVQQALASFYGLAVKLLPRSALPPEAYYAPRRRYRADALLLFLARRLPADGLRILGLTGVDISTTKGRYRDWGVLGLASLDGTACVISSFRCGRGVGRGVGREQSTIRLAKTAVHEIGHTLGLPHCPVRGCLLEDAQGKVATSDREYDICAKCRAQLARGGRAIPAHPRVPWPKPQ